MAGYDAIAFWATTYAAACQSRHEEPKVAADELVVLARVALAESLLEAGWRAPVDAVKQLAADRQRLEAGPLPLPRTRGRREAAARNDHGGLQKAVH